jgi:hypothetical protein
MNDLLGPLFMLAVLIYLFGTPGYIVAWLIHQRRAGSPMGAGLACLAIWLSSLAFAVHYLLTAAWYSEGTSTAMNVMQALLVLVLYVVLPIGSLVYLHRRRASDSPRA